MIRLGFCTGFDQMEAIAAAGFDFLEANFTALARMDEGDFGALCARSADFAIPVEAANSLVTGDLKITGPEVDMQALRAYLEGGFARAARLGIRVVVFGSGAARKVPQGFSFEEGWRQIAAFLRMADAVAGANGVDIVIEPLRRVETNILNYVSEAMAVASLLSLSHVHVLGDTFHMDMSSEPLSALIHAGTQLRHVHVSQSLDDERGRIVPTEASRMAVDALFAVLRGMGYAGRVSVEAGASDLAAEARTAYAILDAARRK